VLLAILLASCADATNLEEADDSWRIGTISPSLAVVQTLPAVCGTPTLTTLIADETVPVGSVQVLQNGTSLYVVYRTDPAWPVQKTALFLGSAASDIPTNGQGNPRVGQFPYKSIHEGSHEVVWQVPIPSSTVVVAAFAEVGTEEVEGAWAEGEEITPGRSWSMFFTHAVSDCVGETVDASGGTVTTPDGKASLVIEAAALSEPVDITIEPATVDDLLQHAEGMGSSTAAGAGADGSTPTASAVDSQLPSVFGVTPIEGTIWNLGPDGLVFDVPSTLVLTYDEAALPEGVEEAELGAFVINGIFERLPATVDEAANTVTATVSHFSTFMVGFASSDLEVTDFAHSGTGPSDVRVGAPISFTAEVRNNGPSASPATVRLEASGDLLFLDAEESCTEATPTFGDVAVSCLVALLDAGETHSIQGLHVVPRTEGDMAVRATVSWTGSDPAPDNDQKDLALVVGPPQVDLRARLRLSSSSGPVVGTTMEFLATVDNLDWADAHGGTLRYEAFGDVGLGDVGLYCAEVDPGLADVAVECGVPPLDAGHGGQLEPFRLIARSPGYLLVSARVTTAAGDIDSNPANDKSIMTLDIGEGVEVDLEPTTLLVSPAREVGQPIVFRTSVYNRGPSPSSGGTLTYQAVGDAGVGQIGSSCQKDDASTDVVVVCNVPPVGRAAAVPVDAFELIPQGNGPIIVRATVSAGEGETDLDTSNDQVESGVQIGPLVAVDLVVENLRINEPNVTAGTSMHVTADVKNLGPEASHGGTIVYFVSGDVDVLLGHLPASCLRAPDPSPGTLRIHCDVDLLAVGAKLVIEPFEVIPQAAGNVVIQAFTTSGPGDYDPTRGIAQLVVPVGPGR